MKPICQDCGRIMGCFGYREGGDFDLVDSEVCCDECDACASGGCGSGKGNAELSRRNDPLYTYWDCQSSEPQP